MIYSISTGPMDYSAENRICSIYVGNSTLRVPFEIVFDTVDEPLESFRVELTVNDSFNEKIDLWGAIQNTSVFIIDDDGMFRTCIIHNLRVDFKY